MLYRVSVSCGYPCQWRICAGGQYDHQQQGANNNGRQNNGAQHGQNGSMRSGAGAAGRSTGTGGGRGLVHLVAHGTGHHGRLLRFKSVGHILAKPVVEVNRRFAESIITPHNLPLYRLCDLHKFFLFSAHGRISRCWEQLQYQKRHIRHHGRIADACTGACCCAAASARTEQQQCTHRSCPKYCPHKSA